MRSISDLQIEIIPYEKLLQPQDYDIDRIIYDLDSQIDFLSSQAEKLVLPGANTPSIKTTRVIAFH